MTIRNREVVQSTAAGVGRRKLSRNVLLAALLGTVCLPAQANAQGAVAREVVNSVIQSVLQSIRDDVYRRTHQAPVRAPLRFTGEDSASQSIYDEAFGALAYAKAPVMKAPPPPPAPPPLIWGIFGSSAYNLDFATAAGLTTRTRTEVVAGGFNVTKIGVFNNSDAVTFILTESAAFSRARLLDSTTPGTTATLAYQNGDFSTDSSITGSWTEADTLVGVLINTVNSSAVSWASNYQYRFTFDPASNSFIEPTAGYTVTDARTPGVVNTRTWEVRAGGRIGTEFKTSGGMTVQPSFTAIAYSPISIDGPVGADALEGKVGGRVNGKLNFIVSEQANIYVQGDGRWIDNTHGYGAMAGFTLRLN